MTQVFIVFVRAGRGPWELFAHEGRRHWTERHNAVVAGQAAREVGLDTWIVETAVPA